MHSLKARSRLHTCFKWFRAHLNAGIKEPRPVAELSAVLPLPETTTRMVATTPHPTQVTIMGDLAAASTVFVTYHDIGLNHRLCFSRLINTMNSGGMLPPSLAFVHVDAPGHEDGAAPLPALEGSGTMSNEMLAQQLHVIIEHLEISKPILGLGAGAGGNVLLRYAADHPSKCRGLVLCNPSLGEATRSEWLALSLVKWLSEPWVRMVPSAVKHMARVHYSPRALACKSLPRAFARSYRVSRTASNYSRTRAPHRCRPV